MKTIAAMLVMFAAALLPSMAMACPACFGASDARTLSAYYASTVLLSLMPFLMIGGVILGVYVMRERPVKAEDR